jgi:hypothetical protein
MSEKLCFDYRQGQPFSKMLRPFLNSVEFRIESPLSYRLSWPKFLAICQSLQRTLKYDLEINNNQLLLSNKNVDILAVILQKEVRR